MYTERISISAIWAIIKVTSIVVIAWLTTACDAMPVTLPPEGDEPSNPAELLGYILKNYEQNPARIDQWQEDGKFFDLTLQQITINKELVKYRGPDVPIFFEDYNVKVDCIFNDVTDALEYSNGDTLRVVGKSKKIEVKGINGRNVHLTLEPCTSHEKYINP